VTSDYHEICEFGSNVVFLSIQLLAMSLVHVFICRKLVSFPVEPPKPKGLQVSKYDFGR
jgi:hypothetical protein